VRVTLREAHEVVVRCLWRLGVPHEDRPLAAAMVTAAERRGTSALAWLDRCNAEELELQRPELAWEPAPDGDERLDARGASAVVVGPRALRRTCGRVAVAERAGAATRIANLADAELLAGAPDVAGAWWAMSLSVDSPGGEMRLRVRSGEPRARQLGPVVDVERPLWERLHRYAKDALLNVERRPDPND
jgi:hypothetical protein